MATTIQVPQKTRLQIEKDMQAFLRVCPRGWKSKKSYIPFESMFQSGELQEITGFIVDFDPDLGPNIKGQTNFDEKRLSISEDTYIGLMKGKGHDRFTVAHEAAHTILHSNFIVTVHRELKVPMKILNRENKSIYFECDAEWQANSGGSALLMPLKDAVEFIKKYGIGYSSVERYSDFVASEYGMSLYASKIRLNVVLGLLRDHKEEVMSLIAA